MKSPRTWALFDGKGEAASDTCGVGVLNLTVVLTGISAFLTLFVMGFINSTFSVHLEDTFDTAPSLTGVLFSIPATVYALSAG